MTGSNCNVYLGYDTALAFWRSKASLALVQNDPRFQRPKGSVPDGGGEPFVPFSRPLDSATSLRDATGSSKEIREAGVFELLESIGLDTTASIDILVGDARYRSIEKNLRRHICSSALPDGSFFKIAERIFVASPELCYLHYCATRDRIDASQFASEISGTYGIEHSTQGMFQRPRISSRERLSSFLDALLQMDSTSKRVRGMAVAQYGIRDAVDNAASPREAALAYAMCLSSKIGGYSISRPIMNAEIKASEELEGLSKKRGFRIDLYWPKERLGVEYLGLEWHTGAAQISEDSKRQNALLALGIREINVTRNQVSDWRQYDAICRTVLRETSQGRRIARDKVVEQRKALHARLFGTRRQEGKRA